MKKLLLLAVCLTLFGCDYTVPVTENAEVGIDAALLGRWERVQEFSQTESLVVLPFGNHEYLISYFSNQKDGLFANASLCQCAGKTLIQIKWIGTAQGALAPNEQVYQFAAYKIEGDKLEVSLLNPEVISRDIKSSDELIKAIEANKDRQDLFREPMVYWRG